MKKIVTFGSVFFLLLSLSFAGERGEELEKELKEEWGKELEKLEKKEEKPENKEVTTFKMIRQQIKQYMKKIEYYYNRQLEDKPKLKGKIVIQITINPKGKVEKYKVISSTLEDKEFEQEILKRVKRWKFSKMVGRKLPPIVFSFVFFPPHTEEMEEESPTY
jgi:TonB family protein